MPKDLVRQVETTRKEIATYDFAGMDNKSLQQSHALRQAAASLRARGPTYDMDDEEEEAEKPRTKRRRNRAGEEVAAFASPPFHGEEDDFEDREQRVVDLNLAHAQTCAAFSADARQARACHFCKDLSHGVRSCPKLLDDSGNRRPYCPFCRSAGHVVTACEKLANKICPTCQVKGHTTQSCPQVVCKECGKKGHMQWKCPSKNSRGY